VAILYNYKHIRDISRAEWYEKEDGGVYIGDDVKF